MDAGLTCLSLTRSCENFISSQRRGDREDGETEESVEAVGGVISRVNATTTNTTPRGNTSIRSEGSPSEPSNGGEHSSDESELTGSLIPDNDSDSDSNF